ASARAAVDHHDRAALDVGSGDRRHETHGADAIGHGYRGETTDARVAVRRIAGAEVAAGNHERHVAWAAGRFEDRTAGRAGDAEQLLAVVLAQPRQDVFLGRGGRGRRLGV